MRLRERDNHGKRGHLTATAKTGARLAYVNTIGAAVTIAITITGTAGGNIARGADQQAFANNVDSAIKAKASLAGLTTTTSTDGIAIVDSTGADIKVEVGAQTDSAGGDEGVVVTALQADGSVATGARDDTTLVSNKNLGVRGYFVHYE